MKGRLLPPPVLFPPMLSFSFFPIKHSSITIACPYSRLAVFTIQVGLPSTLKPTYTPFSFSDVQVELLKQICRVGTAIQSLVSLHASSFRPLVMTVHLTAILKVVAVQQTDRPACPQKSSREYVSRHSKPKGFNQNTRHRSVLLSWIVLSYLFKPSNYGFYLRITSTILLRNRKRRNEVNLHGRYTQQPRNPWAP